MPKNVSIFHRKTKGTRGLVTVVELATVTYLMLTRMKVVMKKIWRFVQ